MSKETSKHEDSVGIDIPERDLEVDEISGGDLYKFFQDFWELNGFDLSTSTRGGGQYVPVGFNHEVAIPAKESQPPIILKATYKPLLNAEEVENSEKRNKKRGEWGNYSSTRVGTVVFGIYAIPEKAGQLVPLLEVSDNEKYGGNNGYLGESIQVVHLGESIRKDSPGMDDDGMSYDEEDAILEHEHKSRLANILAGTVELIS